MADHPNDANDPRDEGPQPADTQPSSPPPASPPPASPPPLPPVPHVPASPTPATPRTDAERRNWAIGAHLSAVVLAFFGGLAVLGPLVVYLVKKDEDTFIAEHSREALNFQLTWLIGGIVGGLIAVVGTVVTVGLGLIVLVPLGIGLAIAWLVFTIQAAIAASRGEYYRYPLTVRMVN